MDTRERISEASHAHRQSHSITSEYEFKIPRDVVDELDEQYDGVDDPVKKCAEVATKEQFSEQHDVPHCHPDVYVEKDVAMVETDHVRVKTVAVL